MTSVWISAAWIHAVPIQIGADTRAPKPATMKTVAIYRVLGVLALLLLLADAAASIVLLSNYGRKNPPGMTASRASAAPRNPVFPIAPVAFGMRHALPVAVAAPATLPEEPPAVPTRLAPEDQPRHTHRLSPLAMKSMITHAGEAQ